MLAECQMRLMQEDDLSDVLAWRNHPSVRACMITQHEITMSEHALWFARARSDKTRRLLIAEGLDGPIGFVQFTGLGTQSAASWGFYLVPGLPRGNGTRLGRTALHFAFRELRLHKLSGEVLAHNDASLRFHEKLGFRREGVLRQHRLVNGEWQDYICFGLLAREWAASE